jgi:hypothetical protein
MQGKTCQGLSGFANELNCDFRVLSFAREWVLARSLAWRLSTLESISLVTQEIQKTW